MAVYKSKRRPLTVLLSLAAGLLLVFSLGRQLVVIAALTADLWQPQGKILIGSPATGANFGMSVAIDGDTAVVGAPKNNGVGAAYVFVRNGAVWSRQAVLTVTNGATDDFFGWDVALAGDTAVISAYGENGETGAVYLFIRNGTVWNQQARLVGGDSVAGNAFGISVAISGNTLLVGAQGNSENGSDSGAAYVFVYNGAAWTQQAKLLADDGLAGDNFGSAVAIWGDTAIIGAPYYHGSGSDSGAAYIFTRNGAVWSQQAKLLADDAAAEDIFGWDVTLEEDTVAIGAWGDDNDRGSVYLFTRNGQIWSQQSKLTAADGLAGDLFGYSTMLAGNVLAVGALDHDGAANDTGAVYIFYRSETGWNQQDKLTAFDGAAMDWMGKSVGVSGYTAIAGAPLDDDDGNGSGAAYLFTLPVYTLTVNISGGGHVELTPPGAPGSDTNNFTSVYITGTVVTLIAVADPAWRFAGWSGFCAGLADCIITMDAAADVTATFSTYNTFLPLIKRP